LLCNTVFLSISFGKLSIYQEIDALILAGVFFRISILNKIKFMNRWFNESSDFVLLLIFKRQFALSENLFEFLNSFSRVFFSIFFKGFCDFVLLLSFFLKNLSFFRLSRFIGKIVYSDRNKIKERRTRCVICVGGLFLNGFCW
jgi:hypothetical protein